MLKVLITYAVNDERIPLDFKNCEIQYVRTGIGKAKAAMRLMDAVCRERPDLVINIGTAGSLVHRVGDVFACYHFIDRDFMKIQLPGLDYELDFSASFPENGLFINWDSNGVCNTGDSFLTEVSGAVEGDVFDMEAYAQALVCKEKDIPFVAVKYVTDRIGENSVKHWEDKLADARQELEHFFKSYSLKGLPY